MNTREEYIARLRKLADLLEATPELILPYTVAPDSIDFYPHGAAETAETARLLPTGWAKNDPNASQYDANYYRLEGSWAGADLKIITSRAAVCERVQVGTETVMVPAVAAIPKHKEERPVFEYRCKPLLAKAVAS